MRLHMELSASIYDSKSPRGIFIAYFKENKEKRFQLSFYLPLHILNTCFSRITEELKPAFHFPPRRIIYFLNYFF